ncbi:MAG: phosphatase PAP2 family protein [Burkholderiales bacterium]|jgi:undecaprenyl-diphosphatase|nr:phosphatase PAP2 family protein [Burkholderiales bacterium]
MFDLLARWELRLCLRMNGVCRNLSGRLLFRCASVLGDGLFWYALMAALLLAERDAAVPPVLHLLAVGLVCTAGYKWLKARTLRPRPYQAHAGIERFAVELDRFSFPSGHTLHAVAFTLVTLAYYPALAGLLWPLTLLVALSRVVLGLHYPSDVLAGAALGAAVGLLSLRIAA